MGNLLKQETDPLGNTIHYAYDKLGNKNEVTDKNGNTTRYTYNGLNKISSKIDPDGHTTYYQYDGLGNLVREATTKRDNYRYLGSEQKYSNFKSHMHHLSKYL